MNIKQAAEQSGVSSPNIRFYEKEGLMTPARNRGNAYRDYTAEDIRTLKLIRMLRMLDMPLPVIQRVLNGEQPLTEALRAQQTVLEQQAAQLAGSIRFCAELTQQAPQVDQLDVDDCLKRMQDPQEPGGFFSGWLRDYRTVAENEQKKRFSIVSEQSINTPEDFAAVLLRYGEAQGSPIRITKGECTRSLSGTASDIRHGVGRDVIAILFAAKHSSRNLSKRDSRQGGNACCVGCGGCSLWQSPL